MMWNEKNDRKPIESKDKQNNSLKKTNAEMFLNDGYERKEEEK